MTVVLVAPPLTAGGLSTLRVTPVCVERVPASEDELQCAVRCVLTALAALHGHGFVHRDVRWPNVLAGPSSTWLLADWELAAEDGAPLPRGALRDALLPPDLAAAADGSAGGDADGALGPYVAADDVWAVGRLMPAVCAVAGGRRVLLGAHGARAQRAAHGGGSAGEGVGGGGETLRL